MTTLRSPDPRVRTAAKRPKRTKKKDTEVELRRLGQVPPPRPPLVRREPRPSFEHLRRSRPWHLTCLNNPEPEPERPVEGG